MTEIFALFDDCINLLREGSDILCRQCECVVGRIDEENFESIFVKLFNFRLVEYQPMYNGINSETTPRFKLFSRVLEMPNHLKRKAETDKDTIPSKFFRPSENNLCLMNVNVPPNYVSDSIMSEFDILNEFNDVSSVSGSSDIDLNDIMPFLLAPMDPFPSIASNIDNGMTLSPSLSNDWPLVVIDDDDDSEVEFIMNSPELIPNTPPVTNGEYSPFTPSHFPATPLYSPVYDSNLNEFPMFATPPPPYPMWPPVNNTENQQVSFTEEEVEAIYRALVLLMNALGIRNE